MERLLCIHCLSPITSLVLGLRLVHTCTQGHVTLGRRLIKDSAGNTVGLSVAEAVSLDEGRRIARAVIDADRAAAGLVSA